MSGNVFKIGFDDPAIDSKSFEITVLFKNFVMDKVKVDYDYR